jgi:hypothetical protein
MANTATEYTMLRSTSELRGNTIEGTDGPVGSVADLLFDDERWTVRWVVADTGSWLTGRQVLLAPEAFGTPDATRGRLPVRLTRKQVEDSPPVGSDEPVSRQMQGRIYDYYGWAPYWGAYGAFPAQPDWGLAGGPPVPGAPAVPPLEAAGGEAEGGDPHLRSAGEVTGYYIKARDGDLGHVEDLLVEDEGWAVRYLVVDTKNWWPGKKVLVAKDWVTDVSWSEQQVSVELTREQIKASPEYDPSGTVERDYEERLHAHYGRVGYWL